jgi:hypothetical protein
MPAHSNISARKYNTIAVLATVFFHAALILLCYLYIIHTPIPPWPEGGGGGGGLGIEVNLGTSEFGLGDVQDNIAMPDFAAAPKTKGTDKDVLTQDNDESATLNDNKTKKTTESDIDQNALYKGTHKGSNQGTAGGHGDQGNPNGNPNANNYKGTGHGDGTGGGDGGGNGPGHGPGNGPGTGPGSGPNKGIHYDLAGRVNKSLPKPTYNIKDEGIVVVSIWVDKQGNVTKAQAGARGTTTSNQTLWKLAQSAALKAKFDTKSDAAEEQKGTITYNFINLN